MDILNKELLDLFQALEKNEVKYLIVGGFATNYHGYNRTTGDIDFWIEDTLKNRKKLVKTFEELKYGVFEELLTLPLIPGYCDVYISDGIYADLMDRIHNFSPNDFEKCYAQARKVKIRDISLRFLHLNDLLKSKKVERSVGLF